ncbi:hypothetical protein [Microvirga puerhi]|uniref:Uncharacterized protein n=1 Tax=Microvirga puerhi TaxID=2876078 RepID=A0ABS7VJT6_9HYPH|nr:hypothetical protein [Microvirga puerhi]MBZ6075297.1 hypothetical protein [Microvirga puerhi]
MTSDYDDYDLSKDPTMLAILERRARRGRIADYAVVIAAILGATLGYEVRCATRLRSRSFTS